MAEQKEKRVRIVGVRLTVAEFGELEKGWRKTDCRKLSDYVRRLVFGKPVVRTVRNKSQDELMAELIVLRKELNAIGVNFNQAVHRLHRLDHAPQMQDWVARFEGSKDIFFDLLNEVVVQVEKVAEVWLR